MSLREKNPRMNVMHCRVWAKRLCRKIPSSDSTRNSSYFYQLDVIVARFSTSVRSDLRVIHQMEEIHYITETNVTEIRYKNANFLIYFFFSITCINVVSIKMRCPMFILVF